MTIPTAPAPTVTGTLSVRCRWRQAVALTPDAQWMLRKEHE